MTTDTTPAFDAEGYAPATCALTCPYCKRGEITPIMRHLPGYYAAEEWAGSECDSCLAEWEKDGSPRKGPHRAFVDQEAVVAAHAAAPTDPAQEKA